MDLGKYYKIIDTVTSIVTTAYKKLEFGRFSALLSSCPSPATVESCFIVPSPGTTCCSVLFCFEVILAV